MNKKYKIKVAEGLEESENENEEENENFFSKKVVSFVFKNDTKKDHGSDPKKSEKKVEEEKKTSITNIPKEKIILKKNNRYDDKKYFSLDFLENSKDQTLKQVAKAMDNIEKLEES